MLKTKVSFKKKAMSFGSSALNTLQQIGKSLVYPIAVLPAAALLLRVGTAIMEAGDENIQDFVYWLGWIIQAPGSIVFDNLAAIFGIGVAFGFAKDHRGEAALVGFLGYLVIVKMVQSEGSLTTLIYGSVMTETSYIITDTGIKAIEYSTLLYIVPFTGNAVDGGGIEGVWLTNLGVFGGITAGLLAALLYNKYSDIQLHPALGFFSGRRFVPIVALVVFAGLSFGLALIWPWLQYLLVLISEGIVSQPEIGAGIYAFLNRLLIPFGLHQVLNVFFWFQVPITLDGYQIFYLVEGSSPVPMLGDIDAFLTAGSVAINGIIIPGHPDYIDATLTGDDAYGALSEANVGVFQTGFFPIMMFGVPAVALAIGMSAEKDHRKNVLLFMGSAAFVSFLTGITEPVEFTFMFISPILYFSYSLLSGVVASLTILTGVSFGFGFSAGAIDLFLSLPTAAELSTGIFSGYLSILAIFMVGILAFPVYYLLTFYIIKYFDLATPGRKDNLVGVVQSSNGDSKEDIETTKQDSNKTTLKSKKENKWEQIASKTIELVGGFENIEDIDNCITRVRLVLKDNSMVNNKKAQKIGYTGSINIGKKGIHLVIGLESEIVAKHMIRLRNKSVNKTKQKK